MILRRPARASNGLCPAACGRGEECRSAPGVLPLVSPLKAKRMLHLPLSSCWPLRPFWVARAVASGRGAYCLRQRRATGTTGGAKWKIHPAAFDVHPERRPDARSPQTLERRNDPFAETREGSARSCKFHLFDTMTPSLEHISSHARCEEEPPQPAPIIPSMCLSIRSAGDLIIFFWHG